MTTQPNAAALTAEQIAEIDLFLLLAALDVKTCFTAKQMHDLAIAIEQLRTAHAEAVARAERAEAERDAVIEIALEADNECTAWYQVVDSALDQLVDSATDSEEYDTGIKLLVSAIDDDGIEARVEDLREDGEQDERRAHILARAKAALDASADPM